MKTITEADIKDKLTKHYGSSTVDRKLHRQVNYDDHKTIGSIFYSLEGSPPKGYAIVIPEIRMVSLYSNWGRRFKIMDDTVVKEVQELNLNKTKESDYI